LIEIKKDAYKSIVVEVEDENEEIISEGQKIEFAIEGTGEKKSGYLKKITGKGDKTKIQIVPFGCQHEEIHSISVIEETSLQLIKE